MLANLSDVRLTVPGSNSVFIVGFKLNIGFRRRGDIGTKQETHIYFHSLTRETQIKQTHPASRNVSCAFSV